MAELFTPPDSSSSSAVGQMPATPQLFNLEPIDVVEAWQQELVDCFLVVSGLISGKSSAEAHDILQQRASESMKSHSELVNGLIYGVLTETGDTYFRQLSLVARDGYAHAIGRLQLVSSSQKFALLRHKVRVQLLWAIAALVRGNAAGVEALVLSLTRQMRGGDVTQPNIWLIQQMLNLLESNYEWLVAHSAVVATSAYAFGRLTLDLGARSVPPELRNQSSVFVVRLIRERFTDCAMVGRDLVRMLQDAAKLPPFRDLWIDLLHRPHHVSPLLAQAGGIELLLRVPTPRMFLANRVSFAMESRLIFILEHVPASGYSRNLMWFVQRFLNTPESDTLYADIIRYICGVLHPSNAVLGSSTVQRYVFLGSLLRYVRSQVTAANAKLALFYDWLFYDPQADNIMNVEPGVLIMARSVDRYPFLTESFIEFLAFVTEAYAPSLAPQIRQSVGLVMRIAVEKGVIPSLVPIYEQPRISRSTRRHMQTLFPQLVPQRESLTSNADGARNGSGVSDSENEQDDSEGMIVVSQSEQSIPPLSLSSEQPPLVIDDEPPVVKTVVDLAALDPVSRMFHDDDEPYTVPEENMPDEYCSDSDSDGFVDVPPLSEDNIGEPWSVDGDSLLEDPSLWVFGSTLADFIENKSPRTAAEIVNVFAQSEASTLAVARILAFVVLDDDSVELEDIETNAELARMGESDGIEHDLLHAILTAAATAISDNDGGSRVLDLLVQLTRARVDVGFRWLLFCVDANISHLYSRYVGRFASGTVALALARDLGILQERFTALFYEMLPAVYSAFPIDLPGNSHIVRSVVALIDQPQVYRLNSLISRGMLKLFGSSGAVVVADTMECDAFEQVCVWQLLAAEIAGDSQAVSRVARRVLLQSSDTVLDPLSNSEAANGLLSLLRTVSPTPRLVKLLVRYYQAPSDDTLVKQQRADLCGCVLTAWIQNDSTVLRRALATISPTNRSALVDAWTERFELRRFCDRTIAELLLQQEEDCGGSAVKSPPEMSVADLFTPTLESLAVDEPLVLPPIEADDKEKTGSGIKRRSNSITTRSKGARINSSLVKRRRRNVITSDDDDEEEQEDIISSSPVLSSSSLESDDDE
ncbi:Integrator complex subunit 3 [Coemansia sp. S100]|nr:Integrator complex subunit 3 [Coemansia sp. S100]